MSTFDIVIKEGTVFDGLRTPRYKSDIGIKDGKIATIGNIDAGDGIDVIDASGKHVAPGFVDLHTHYDSQLFWDPWCTISGWHGVTSVVIGNCGFGFAPTRPEDQDRAMLTLSRNEAVPLKTMRAGMPWDWETFPQFLDSVERTPKGVNVMSLVPLSPLYAYVVGVEKAREQRASDDELEAMCALVVEAMEAGGCGWSSQLLGEYSIQNDFDGSPMVTDCMTERELIAFSRALRKVGRGTTQITGTLDHAELIARESGRPIIWNALAPRGSVNQHGEPMYPHREAIERLNRLNRDEGVRVFAQASTIRFVSEITLEDYNLMDMFPPWKEACLGSAEERTAKFADPERRVKLQETVDAMGGFGAARYPMTEMRVNWISSDVPNAQEMKERYEGFTLGEISARDGKGLLDTMLDIAVAAKLRVGFGTTTVEPELEPLREVATWDCALPGVSDGGAHTKFITTARYGTEVIGYWCREHDLMPLEEAHWRLSALPAMAVGLKGRGCIVEGAPADVVVYDYATIDALPQERAWDYPAGEWRLIQRAQGYDRIIVNGVTTFAYGECTQATPGRLLRHGTD